eukprot:2404536-Prymnesium_polylepis.1
MAVAVVEEEVRRSRRRSRRASPPAPQQRAAPRRGRDLRAKRSAGVNTRPRRWFESRRGFESGRTHLCCRPLKAPD